MKMKRKKQQQLNDKYPHDNGVDKWKEALRHFN